jgi:hypothetical protein
MIMVAERPYAVSAALRDRLAGSRHDVRADLINDKFTTTTTTIDIAVQLGSRKPCGDVDDQGARVMFGNTTGAFVTSLGDRPPSPPGLTAFVFPGQTESGSAGRKPTPQGAARETEVGRHV